MNTPERLCPACGLPLTSGLHMQFFTSDPTPSNPTGVTYGCRVPTTVIRPRCLGTLTSGTVTKL